MMKTVRDRDASFSSYLRPGNKATTITAAPLEDATTELSIFDARKYFNDDDDNDNNNNIQKVSISRVSPMERIPERGDVTITEATRYSSASSSVDSYAHIRNYRGRSFHVVTPTASSEASWNSQTGLLSHPPGAIPVSMQNPQNPKNLQNPKLSKSIWLLRRKCPCTGKKSVRVKESTQESKTQISQQERDTEHHNNNNVRNHITPNNWILNQTPALAPAPATATIIAAKSQRFHNSNSHRVVSSVRVPFTDGFTFPVLNPNNPITKLKLANVNGIVEEDPPRESLEVFRPPDESTSHSQQSKDSFDGASASTFTSISTTATATATGFFYGRRSMEEGSTTQTITEWYEPSEASIEWSVTTAEGHDEAISNGVAGCRRKVEAERWKRFVGELSEPEGG
ncbi:Protein PHYTOCHROME KINASE SUBSTRATE 4 [Glycine soja]|nr:Protein PHYTOCHROME KINASE SUBSTRATE 4 [Glycine soja]